MMISLFVRYGDFLFFTCFFFVVRFLLSLLFMELGHKKQYTISLLVATFHSILAGFFSLVFWYRFNDSSPYYGDYTTIDLGKFSGIIFDQGMYNGPTFALIFSTSYFIYDLLNTLFTLPMNIANLSSIIHHAVVICFFSRAIPVYPYFYMSVYDIQLLYIAVSVLLAELTMPTLNLQWLLDTYFNENTKIKKFSNFLAGFNILLYFVFRVLYANFLLFWIIIPSGILTNVILVGITATLYALNHIWFYKIMMKYGRRALSIFNAELHKSTRQ